MAKPFTLTQLRYFAVVAELENMTAAADRLLVTQSTLSTAMAQLEASLSTQLFVRLRTKGLRLTPTGRQLAQDLRIRPRPGCQPGG
jgi:DNA-binding transcriptional LysR family regulator